MQKVVIIKRCATLLCLICLSLLLLPTACERNRQDGNGSGYRPVLMEQISPDYISKTYYRYESGRLIKREYQSTVIYNNYEHTETNTIKYPTANTIIYYYLNPDGEEIPKWRYTVQDNKVIKWEALGWNGDQEIASEEKNYQYSKGRLTVMTTRYRHGMTGEWLDWYTKTYLYDDQKLKEIQKVGDDPETILEKIVVEYTGDRVSAFIQYESSVDTLVPRTKEEYVYEGERVNSLKYYSYYNGMWYDRGEMKLDYDEFGNCNGVKSLNDTIRINYEAGSSNIQLIYALPDVIARHPLPIYIWD